MTERAPIKVILADDHPLVLEGLCACLQIYSHIHVVGEARTGKQALALAKDLLPDVVLMDINMPELNGLDATEIFKERYPNIKLLILSMHDNREYISTAIMYGAKGYLLKDVPTKEVVAAIEAVHAGGSYFSAGISEMLLKSPAEPGFSGPLTTREQNVLLLLAKGQSNKEVARKLDISVRTVETHRKNIKRKLDIGTTAGLTRYAIENGLIV